MRFASTHRRIATLERSPNARRRELLVMPDEDGDASLPGRSKQWLQEVFDVELPDGRRGLRLNPGVSAAELRATLEMLYGDADEFAM